MEPAQPIPEGYISREAFRLWYAAQPKGRFERVDGRIVAMAPERAAHALVKGAVYRALHRAIAAAGVPCQALPDGFTVQAGDSDYEPDALVNCGDRLAGSEISAPSPVILVEVLSPSTASVDTGGKLADYFLIPSVMHYLIVHPTRRRVIHHCRMDERIDTAIVANGSILMEPPGITLTLDEIYEDGMVSEQTVAPR